MREGEDCGGAWDLFERFSVRLEVVVGDGGESNRRNLHADFSRNGHHHKCKSLVRQVYQHSHVTKANGEV
jgi:hypothetical protein